MTLHNVLFTASVSPAAEKKKRKKKQKPTNQTKRIPRTLTWEHGYTIPLMLMLKGNFIKEHQPKNSQVESCTYGNEFASQEGKYISD